MRPSIVVKLFSLALITFLLLPGASSLAAPPTPPAASTAESAMAQLESQVGDVQVTEKRGLGTASYVVLPRTGPALAMPGLTLHEQALAFFQEYRDLFGIRYARGELRGRRQSTDLAGGDHLAFTQTYQGVPVFGGELSAHFAPDRRLVAASGAFVPEINVNVTPTLSAEQAGQAALAVVSAEANVNVAPLRVVAADLVIYRTGLVQGVEGQSFLTYYTQVTNDDDVREFVVIDAQTGAILDRFAGIHDTLHRVLYDPSPSTLVWEEGDALPTGDVDWNNELYGAEETYNFFGSLTDGAWLSYDGASAFMRTVNNDPRISCPNANWNGWSTNYCSGVTGDDTVAHEWGHAYTEHTHNLMYAWQPGALNESYSDIWGEVVDLLNARGLDTPAGLRGSTGEACSSADSAASGPKTDAAIRWVSGEDDPAFGGPIRDMWRPECHGHPGRVWSTSYYCFSGDGGGVHTNSGVPNHGFALTMDGGTYNGQTITGLGIVKASHIYWHAQLHYHTNTSDFSDHANALAQSCQDLKGQPLYDPKTTGPGTWGATTAAITQSDCDQVDKVALAVQFRTVPGCNFAPMFNPNTPALCSTAGQGPQNYLFQGFESGMAGWTTQQTPSSPSTWDNRPWRVVTGAPDGHPGSVVFGPNPVVGDCSADLENGITSLLSPVITIPAGSATPIRMAWDHLVSMEIDYDGGNLKASVNNGAFVLVPASAFTFNPYNRTLTRFNNDNPMKGEVAWSGGDAGAVTSKWGQSQIDLSRISVDPGDTVQFKWDLGSDSCNGWDGWYVDDVRVYSCAPCSTPSAPANATISRANATTVNLNWAAADGASQYEVWTAQNTPFFDVTGKTCANPAPYACSVVADTDRSAADLGNASVNHSYVVRGANSCGATSGVSNRIGEFEFDLVKGG